MTQENQRVVVVCGYGCNIDSPLAPYLDRVQKFLEGESHAVPIILCGGETQEERFPGKSEARVMFDYLTRFKIVEVIGEYSYILQDHSYTTHFNIRLAAKEIRKRIRPQEGSNKKFRITIFCEAQRAPDVVMLARHYMGGLVESIDDITVETVSWERADPFKQVWKMMYNKLALTFPWLGLAEHAQRQRIVRSFDL